MQAGGESLRGVAPPLLTALLLQVTVRLPAHCTEVLIVIARRETQRVRQCVW